MINVSCSRPQRSDAGEARTRGPSVSIQALYHWAPRDEIYYKASTIHTRMRTEHQLKINLIETPFNTLASRVDPHQPALVRAA